jgi:hypothetical protein
MKCICCEKKIKLLHKQEQPSEEDLIFSSDKVSALWDASMVGRLSAGYGSIFDGDQFVIGICDECIKTKASESTLVYVGNYMFKVSEDIEKSKQLWRRNNNLDELL